MNRLYLDIDNGILPAVSHVRGVGVHSEHPGQSTITASTRITKSVIDAINNSTLYNRNTVILIVPDESGGFYDHVHPPTNVHPIDGVFYGNDNKYVSYLMSIKILVLLTKFVHMYLIGPRIPLMAVGYAVNAPSKEGGYISHNMMEPSSIIKFMEWNWLGGETGQLKGRDQVCSNLGSLFNSSMTGVQVPIF